MSGVKERLKKTGDEETVGGFAYLAQIAENTPSISNIKTYAQHVRELSGDKGCYGVEYLIKVVTE